MKKILIPVLISAMLLGSFSVFAEKLDAPIGSLEDLQTYSGIEVEKTERNGVPVYKVLETSKEGSEKIYESALEENNRRIEKLWAENALTKFAEKKKLEINFDEANYGLVQFNCTLSQMTVDELANQLRHQVVKKTEKDHQHDWMYFNVTDKNGDSKLFRYCQECEKWQAFHLE